MCSFYFVPLLAEIVKIIRTSSSAPLFESVLAAVAIYPEGLDRVSEARLQSTYLIVTMIVDKILERLSSPSMFGYGVLS